MPRCSAASCRNMGSHTFPKDPYMRSQWEKAMNKENFKASKHSRLCYDHFTPSDYVDVCLSTGISPYHRYLKKTAVPSIFLSKIQQSTSGASLIKTRTASRPQICRHLKRDVVPSIFPWTKKSAMALDVTQQQKASRLKNTRRIIRKGVVPSVFTWSKTEHFKPKERRGKVHAEVDKRRLTVSLSKTQSVGCKNQGTHPFPKDVKRREQWVKAVRRKNWTPESWARLCGNHFKHEDYHAFNSYTGDPNMYKRLKKTAVPSIFSTPSKSFASSFQQKRNLNPSKKNNDLKKNAVLPKIAAKHEESNSSEINSVLRNKSMRLRNRKAYLLNRKCSVPHCNTRPSNEISLHPCPNNAAVRNEWAEALRVSYQYVKNMVACSLHFTKLDFIQSKKSERVLKHSAVPSRYLPSRKKGVVPVKNKLLRKVKAFERQQTMTDTVDETKEVIQEDEVTRECRACLKQLDDKKSCCNVFQAWAPPWDGMEATIAEDLAKLANVEISATDRHSKVLCVPCYQNLLDAATFSSKVRNCDLILRMRFTAEIDMEKVWPKPIQVDKNINGSVFNNPMDVEIKQEVVSEEEYPVNGTDNSYIETELDNLDIKIEPEELVEPPPLNITINGTISLDPLNSQNIDVTNGTEVQQETPYIEMEVKQEPTSEGEQEIEQTPDLSLECLLCTKSFHSVTGLKAHVIAQHSYKTVKRKADGSMSPEKKRREKHQCAICKRSFQTSTDLMVHETCHNKHSCYGCTQKFDSFELLSRHRKRCKANIGKSVQKLKTLEDVKRPLPEEKFEYLAVEIKKTESISNVEKDIEMKESETIKDVDVEMKDINSKQKKETSEEYQVADKVENYKKPESVNKEVENGKQLKSKIHEPELDKLVESETKIKVRELDQLVESESIIQETEVDQLMESESLIQEQEVGNVMVYSESIIKEQEVNNVLESDSIILEQEIGNVRVSENLILDQEVDEFRTSSITLTDSITFMESESAIEEVDNDKKSERVIEEVDNDKKIEIVVTEIDNDKNLEIVFEAEDIKLERLIEEEETKNEQLVTDEKKTDSGNIEIKHPDSNLKLNLKLHSTQNETEPTLSDADIPVETLDNDDNCT